MYKNLHLINSAITKRLENKHLKYMKAYNPKAKKVMNLILYKNDPCMVVFKFGFYIDQKFNMTITIEHNSVYNLKYL